MMWHDADGWGWLGWVLMTAGMVAFWALLITAIVLVIRYLATSRGPANPPSVPAQIRAEQVLAERFARGEIDDNEYRQRLAQLREHPSPPT
jgi:putative membrane protein